jgi:hypothetical protein
VLIGLAVVAGALAAVSLVYGPVRLTVSGRDLFKSSGVMRPVALLLVAGVLAGAVRRSSQVAVVVVAASVLPFVAYRQTLANMETGEHPMHTARDCVARVNAQPGMEAFAARGLWVDGLMDGFGHEHYLYFRKIQPWTVAPKPEPMKLAQYLYSPGEMRPSLVLDSVYQDFIHSPESPLQNGRALPPMVSFGDVVLLLPGPYAVCSSEAGRPD